MKHGQPLFKKQVLSVTDKEGKDTGMLYLSRQTARARCKVSIAEMMQGKKSYAFRNRWRRLKEGLKPRPAQGAEPALL